MDYVFDYWLGAQGLIQVKGFHLDGGLSGVALES